MWSCKSTVLADARTSVVTRGQVFPSSIGTMFMENLAKGLTREREAGA
jgi:hypothetical protein